jgi:hypothetical protein
MSMVIQIVLKDSAVSTLMARAAKRKRKLTEYCKGILERSADRKG